jgi:hypothetical protein
MLGAIKQEFHDQNELRINMSRSFLDVATESDDRNMDR